MDYRQLHGQRTITGKGILRLMASHWKYVLALVLAGAVLTGGTGVVKQYRKVKTQTGQATTVEKKVTVNEAEFQKVKAYVEYEEIVNEKQEYIDRSILMNLDPMHKHTGTIRYSFQYPDGLDHGLAALAGIYGDEIQKQDSVEFILQRAGLTEDVSCFKEVMGIDLTSVPGTIAVQFSYYDDESVLGILNAIQQFFQEHPAIGDSVGGVYAVAMAGVVTGETVDTALLDAQAARKADLVAMQGQLALLYTQLEDNEIKYLELYRNAHIQEGYVEGQPLISVTEAKISEPDYVKEFFAGAWKGAGVGWLIGLAIAVILYLFSPVLLEAEDLQEMYGIPVLVSAKHVEKSVEPAELMVSILDGRDHDQSIALITSKRELAESDIAQSVLQRLQKKDVDATIVYDVGNNPLATDKLKGMKETYFLESAYHSRHRQLAKQIQICSELKLQINGSFVI